TVDLAGGAWKPGEANQVEVVAWNAAGFLSSRGAVALWTPEGAPQAAAPELYAIVIGVSRYASPHLNLRFAAKDARDMAEALSLGARRLFGADKVHLTLLTSDDKAAEPTRANIEKAFAEARKARP